MIDQHNDSGNASLNFVTIILLTLSGLCKILSTKFIFLYTSMYFMNIAFTDIYECTFKTLSLISVLMVLVINWPKFKKRIQIIRLLWKKRLK